MSALFLNLIIFLFFCLSAHADYRKVTLFIYADLSPSMISDKEPDPKVNKSHLAKLARLIPQMTKSLQEACEDYTVSINNIRYLDNRDKFNVFGEPHFITKETPDGINLLQRRMLNPYIEMEDALRINSYEDAFPVGSQEITYGSISTSLAENQQRLLDQDLVAAIILTDAIPVFEDRTPREEAQQIASILGYVPFLASSISVSPATAAQSDADPKLYCVPDNTGALDYSSAYLIHEFIDLYGGVKADICEDNFEVEINQFIDQVITQAGCKVMM